LKKSLDKHDKCNQSLKTMNKLYKDCLNMESNCMDQLKVKSQEVKICRDKKGDIKDNAAQCEDLKNKAINENKKLAIDLLIRTKKIEKKKKNDKNSYSYFFVIYCIICKLH
jgi:uncharacterized beta-barrel protein YwiB (DUF1934 family)